MLLDVTIAEAENMKKSQANVDRHGIDSSQFFTIKRSQHDDEKTINMLELLEVTEARYISIFDTELDFIGR